VDNNARNATAKPLVLPEIVTLPGEIDVTNAQGIGDELQAACGPGVAVVIADMTGTAFLDSSGVRYLLLASEHAAKANAELRLVTESAAVLRVLVITGVDGLLKIYPNLQAALTNPGLAEAQEAPSDGQYCHGKFAGRGQVPWRGVSRLARDPLVVWFRR
jgi:anti-sigma B factor antagonist